MKPLQSLEIALMLTACLYVQITFAQNSKIESYLYKIGKARQLNGNILMARNERVITNRAFGYADFESQKPNNTDLHFNLASVSKLFTSTAILQLRDKMKLSLDDHLIKYFPDFPFADVTVRHLLTHTSGLPDLELFENIIQKYPDTVITNKNIIPELKKWSRGLNFKPGDQYQYCNTGYCLLALVVESVVKMPFEKYLKQYIFQPAAMNNTYVSIYPGHTYNQDKNCVKMHAQPHPYYDTTYLYVDSLSRFKYTNYNCSGTIGESNIITTTGDLLNFDRAFFGGKLIKPTTMEEAFTPLKLNNGETWYGSMDTMLGDGKMTVGLGWDIFEQPGYGRSVGHGGYKFGLATFYFHQLENIQTIIAFDNTAGSEFGRVVTSAFYLMNGIEPFAIRNHHSLAFVYGSTLVKQGPDAAAAIFNASKSDTAHYYLSEWEFNQLGGNLLYGSSFEGHKDLALEVFKINTLLFPGSFNTYDSYGAGLREIGKKQQAIMMYQKSIALNPNNEDGKMALKELLDSK